MSPLQTNDSKPLFTRGPSLGMRLLLLALLSGVLMVLDNRENHLERTRQALSVAVYPIRLLVDLPFQAADWLSGNLSDHSALLIDNKRLKERQLIANAQLQRLSALEAENARLRALLDSSAKVEDRVLVAEIMAVDMDPYRHKIVVNKGANVGLVSGQAMLDAQGIVGQITEVDRFSSQAILISDPNHATPVELNRNGLRTIAVGTGDTTKLVLPFLQNNADIENGDLLVSSGLGGKFPAGYPVAIVTSIQRDLGESFATIEARPAAALNRVREVLVVRRGALVPQLESDTEPETTDATAEPDQESEQ